MDREAVRDKLLEQTWSSPHLCAKFTYDNITKFHDTSSYQPCNMFDASLNKAHYVQSMHYTYCETGRTITHYKTAHFTK